MRHLHQGLPQKQITISKKNEIPPERQMPFGRFIYLIILVPATLV